MPRSCMKTRTSSYKLLRKRHNYGRRGSEPSALAHIGRALNDELDTVYARAPLREACPQQRRERKKERKNICVRYIYTTLFLNRLPIFLAISFPRDERRCHPSRHLPSLLLSLALPPPLPRPSTPTPSPFHPHSVAARLISPRDEKVTKHLKCERKRHACFLDPTRLGTGIRIYTCAYKSRLENLVGVGEDRVSIYDTFRLIRVTWLMPRDRYEEEEVNPYRVTN